MKKYLIILFAAVLSIGFTGCEKDTDPGATAVAPLAGHWTVTAVAVDQSGNVIFEDADLFGLGRFQIDTYNTSANTNDTIWVNDNKKLWDFKVKVKADINNLTFAGSDLQNRSYDSKVTIENGKILKGAATTPSGMPADSIVFTVTFDDDTYPAKYGYYGYRVAGFRYTGFEADN